MEGSIDLDDEAAKKLIKYQENNNNIPPTMVEGRDLLKRFCKPVILDDSWPIILGHRSAKSFVETAFTILMFQGEFPPTGECSLPPENEKQVLLWNRMKLEGNKYLVPVIRKRIVNVTPGFRWTPFMGGIIGWECNRDVEFVVSGFCKGDIRVKLTPGVTLEPLHKFRNTCNWCKWRVLELSGDFPPDIELYYYAVVFPNAFRRIFESCFERPQ